MVDAMRQEHVILLDEQDKPSGMLEKDFGGVTQALHVLAMTKYYRALV